MQSSRLLKKPPDKTLRLLRPNLYRALRANKERLTGTNELRGRGSRDLAGEYDKLFFGAAEQPNKDRLRRALMRLFPRLDGVWSNMHHGEGFASEWARQRRVCAEAHFDSYFRFSLGDETLPRKEIDEIVAHASDQAFVTTALREALGKRRANGSTKAALLLEELNLHADMVADADVGPLLTAIFKMGDELDVPADQSRGFGFANNTLRMHWLLRRLTRERFDLAKRSQVLTAACETAPLGWLVDFASSAYEDYHPRDSKKPEAEQNCLTTAADAERLRAEAMERIRSAATSGELLGHQQLPYLLYRWRDADGGTGVKQWTEEQLKHDDAVMIFAKAFTSYSWSQGFGDMVAKRSTRASVGSLEAIMDKARFRARAEELAASDILSGTDAETIREFLEAWKRHDKNPRA